MIEDKFRAKAMSFNCDQDSCLIQSQSRPRADCSQARGYLLDICRLQYCGKVKPCRDKSSWRRRKPSRIKVIKLARKMVSLLRLNVVSSKHVSVILALVAFLLSIDVRVDAFDQVHSYPLALYNQHSYNDHENHNQDQLQAGSSTFEYFLGDNNLAHSAPLSTAYDLNDQTKLFDDGDDSSLLPMSDDLLDLQSSSASHTTSAASPGATKSEVTRAPSSASSSTERVDTKKTATKTPAVSTDRQVSQPIKSSNLGGNLISNQLNTVSKVLHHMAPGSVDYQQQTVDTSRAAALAHKVRKTINAAAAASSIGMSPTRKQQQQPQVGQENNQQPGINGNIEFPSTSSMRPFMVSALKTIPVKLGSVGWKLLQLIAWKKIYRSHHPATGDVVIEPEVKSSHEHKSASPLEDDGDDDDDAEIGGGTSSAGKSAMGGVEIDLNKQASPMANKMTKMNHMYPRNMAALHGAMGAQGLHGLGGLGPQGFMFDRGSESVMNFQKHLLPQQLLQSQANQSPVSAAAAAAAAAIQSQWLKQQLAASLANQAATEPSALDGDSKKKPQVSPIGSGVSTRSTQPALTQPTSATNQSSSNGGASNRSHLSTPGESSLDVISAKDHRRRHTLASLDGLAGNWYASPAQAYANAAAAAAAAAAASASAVQQSRHHHQGRLGTTFPALVPFNQMMYQSLFDNAAALAVQNAVKLPQSSSMFGAQSSPTFDFLDQPDSLGSSSSMSFGPSSLSTSSLASYPEWSAQNSGHPHRSGLLNLPSASRRFHSSPAESVLSVIQNRPRHISDSLLALNDFPTSGYTTDASALNSLTEFDDTPVGKFINTALGTNLAGW